MSGVPFGVQTARLSVSTTGWPFDITRVAATTHWAVTQGRPLTGHPAMRYGVVIVTMGCPLTSTRGFGAVGVAMPP